MPKFTKPEPGAPILVELGGQMLELKLDFGALKKIEREYGISLLKDELDNLTKMMQSPLLCAALILAALQSCDPNISVEWLDKQLNARTVDDLLPYLFYAFKGVWLEPLVARLEGRTDVIPLPPPPADREPAAMLTGSRSGPSEDTISVLASRTSGG